MSAQLLVNVVSVVNLGAGASLTVAHGLLSGGVSVAPTLVFPDRATPIIVSMVTATTITFTNTGLSAETAKFRCERGWQPEVDAATVPNMFWQGGGTGGIAPLNVAPRQGGSFGGWSDYEEFEVEALGANAHLVGETGVMLLNIPSPAPQQHMVVWNGRIMRVFRDYLLVGNMVVLGRPLTDGEVLAVYYNRAGV